MVNYPIRFEGKALAEKEQDYWSLETSEGFETSMSVPEEFGGDSANPSPEDLFNASLNSCILATFKVTAERKNLDYEKVRAESETSLERNEDGRPVMKSAKVKITVSGIQDEQLGKEVAQIAEKNCFIHNSVMTDVQTEFEFE